MLYGFDDDDGGEAEEAEEMGAGEEAGEEAGEAGETGVVEEAGEARKTDVFDPFETDSAVVIGVPRDLLLMVAARAKAKGAPHC